MNDSALAGLPDISQRGGDPRELAGELLWIIENAITTMPRSQQERLGPSEIGIPCARRIGYRLAGVEESNTGRGVPWKPTIGTAVHDWLKEVFRRTNRVLGEAEAGPRFLLEWKVIVGQILGDDIDGSCDLYDRVTCTVVDWKIVGAEQLRKYKKEGPGEQYRTQGHAYGRGWVARGLPVDHVAVMFLPRDRELKEAHYWTEPYDERIALRALSRVEGITKLVRAMGPAAMPLLPTAEAWCQFCPYFLPASTELAEACPGHAGADVHIA